MATSHPPRTARHLPLKGKTCELFSFMREFLKGVWGKLLARSFPHKTASSYSPNTLATADIMPIRPLS